MLSNARLLLFCRFFSYYHRPCIFMKDILLTKSKIIVKRFMFMPELPEKHSKTVNIFLWISSLGNLFSRLQSFRSAPHCRVSILVECACVLMQRTQFKISNTDSMSLFWPTVGLEFNEYIVGREMPVDQRRVEGMECVQNLSQIECKLIFV